MPGGTLYELLETLNAEVYVDVDKLRQLARYGVPKEVRGEVWKYLLGVELADRSHEVTMDRAGQEEYARIEKHHSEFARHIRRDTERYLQRYLATVTLTAGSNGNGGRNDPLLSLADASAFESVISAYLHRNSGVEYSSAMVPLCAPLVATLERESDVFFCFERIMNVLKDFSREHSIKTRVAEFITLFRRTLPGLFNYFQEEEVELSEWSSSWLHFLLTKELPLETTIRLWDYYFSHNDFLHFHTYVCLAILKFFQPDLEELEHSEIRSFLSHLPSLNIEQSIVMATNIQTEIQKQDQLDT
ncbi:hypothetical protein IWQ60_010770 [Tieghemiomyces parasiticus]|uniref:Rab-GAP TBC domain-containing protein n=1 Tax=Tieghemiomyces parasiticus TaxID=78921 RepID=A0A9W7ZTL2_9FUNG|nr:hypothetical protein IWQ60_010770 [Tieghemiomyces parasiticus]